MRNDLRDALDDEEILNASMPNGIPKYMKNRSYDETAKEKSDLADYFSRNDLYSISGQRKLLTAQHLNERSRNNFASVKYGGQSPGSLHKYKPFFTLSKLHLVHESLKEDDDEGSTHRENDKSESDSSGSSDSSSKSCSLNSDKITDILNNIDKTKIDQQPPDEIKKGASSF